MLLVGLDNPWSIDPHYALYPMPRAAAGGRLLRLMRDVDPAFSTGDYLRCFARANLVATARAPVGPGRAAALRAGARELRNWIAATALKRTVLLGDEVWRAMMGPEHAQAVMLSSATLAVPDVLSDLPPAAVGERDRPIECYRLPHPSGRNRALNDPVLRRQCGELLLALADWSRDR